MEIRGLIKTIERVLKLEIIDCDNRKDNINSSYNLAKLDFRCIENMEDCIETYQHIIDDLRDLQDRIIERNKERLF